MREWLTGTRVEMLILAAALTMLIAMGAWWSTRDGKGLLDWGSFWASADAANRGEDPYGVYPLTFHVADQPARNLNPPVTIYALQPFARLDPHTSYAVWYGISLGLFVFSTVALYRAYPENGPLWALWPFALTGLWHTLELGQIYMPLVAAATIAWLLLRERADDWRAGVLLGLIAAVKPQFLLLPGLLFLAGSRRAGLAGFGTFAGLWTVPLLLEGPGIYQDWLAATPPVLPANTLAGNSSLTAIMGRMDLAEVGLAMSVLAVAGAGLWALLRKPWSLEAVGVGLLVALLVGPLTWPGYTLLLLPVIAAIGWLRALPALIFLAFPYWLVVELVELPQPAPVVAGSVYGVGLLAFGVILLRSRSRLRSPRPGAAPRPAALRGWTNVARG